MSDGRVQSVERGIDILMALANGPKTLTEVKIETGLSKGTAFRLLASLNYENLVVKEAHSNLYMLGPGFLRLFQGVMQGVGAITAVAKPALTSLWEETEETVTVHVRVGAERICIEELPSPQPIRYVSTLGAAAPLHVGSAGKVLIAFMESAEMEKTLQTLPLLPVTSATISDLDALRAELDTVRRQGYAMSHGERIPGASAVSVPVRGLQGFLASLSVLGPADRLPRKRRLELVPLLQSTAAGIGAALSSAGASGRPTELAS
jgi:DNA-binding IclR family transcriptional regulator